MTAAARFGGTDLRWRETAGHSTSWLCLGPGNNIPGSILLSSSQADQAVALMRVLEATIGHSDTALGAYYRQFSPRLDKQKAVKTRARKIAGLFTCPPFWNDF